MQRDINNTNTNSSWFTKMTEVQTCSSIAEVLVVVCTDYVYVAFSVLAFSYRALVHCPMVDHGSGQIAQFVGFNRIQILSNFICWLLLFHSESNVKAESQTETQTRPRKRHPKRTEWQSYLLMIVLDPNIWRRQRLFLISPEANAKDK